MKITRRLLAILFVVSAPLRLLTSAPAAKNATAKGQYLAYVGTYTTKTNSKGIYSFHFDAATGQLSAIGVAAETPDPSWVAVHPGGKYLYAANEAGKASAVSAFAVDAKSGKLTLLNQIPSLGEDPCYLSFDKSGKYLLVANYSSGTIAVFPVLADGRLGEHTALVKDQGATGPNKERQDGPHAHWIEVSSDNRFAFVADLGLDAILSYRFDASKGSLTPNKPFFLRPLTAGAGPRHATFSPGGGHFMSSAKSIRRSLRLLTPRTTAYSDTLAECPRFPQVSSAAMMRRKSLSIRVGNGSLPQIVAMTPSQFFPSILPMANSRRPVVFRQAGGSRGILRPTRAANTCWRRTSSRTTLSFSRLILRRAA